MEQKLLTIISALVLISVVQCENCQNPQIISTVYTTQDATVLKHIAYISEFNVKCQKGTSSHLYALFGDSIVPVASVGPSKYQLSWTEDVKHAKTGELSVKIFDEVGYAAVRKALRSGDDITTVPSFSTISVNHPGTYKGPWISCEFLAVILSVGVAYYAIHFRSKLLS